MSNTERFKAVKAAQDAAREANRLGSLFAEVFDDTTCTATALLISARGFVERGWSRWRAALDGNGRPVNPSSDKAAAWCAMGALTAAGLQDDFRSDPAYQRLLSATDDIGVACFNISQTTTEPVLAAFDRAIAGK